MKGDLLKKSVTALLKQMQVNRSNLIAHQIVKIHSFAFIFSSVGHKRLSLQNEGGRGKKRSTVRRLLRFRQNV